MLKSSSRVFLLIGLLVVMPFTLRAQESSAPGSTSWRAVRPELAPSFRFEEDNFNREFWRFDQRAVVRAGERTSVSAVYQRARYSEVGIAPVSEDVAGLAVEQQLLEGQVFKGEWLYHDLSKGINEFSTGFAVLESQWNDALRTEFEGGRDTLETAQSLRAKIHEDYVRLNLEWQVIEHWTFLFEGWLGELSDNNNHYKSDWAIAREIPWIQGVQAVYMFSTDSMSERATEYYSPHRVEEHKAGVSYYGTPNEKSWIWGRYLFGYGEELGVDPFFVQSVDLVAEYQVTDSLAVQGGFGWSRSPTYRSNTYEVKVSFKF